MLVSGQRRDCQSVCSPPGYPTTPAKAKRIACLTQAQCLRLVWKPPSQLAITVMISADARPQAVNEQIAKLGLPIAVRLLHCKKVKVRIPWFSWSTNPVEIVIDGLLVVLEPTLQSEWSLEQVLVWSFRRAPDGHCTRQSGLVWSAVR